MHRILNLLVLLAPLTAHAVALPTQDLLDAVQSVVIDGPIQLEFEAGMPAGLSVLNAECQSKLTWELNGGTLRLSVDQANTRCSEEPVKVELTVGAMGQLVVHGRAEASISGLVVPRFHLEFDGSGDIELDDIDCDQLDVVASGSSDLMATGRAARQRFTLSGEGDMDARALAGTYVYVNSSGDGDVHVNAETTLTIISSGSADIRYAGRPRVQQRLSGTGTVLPSD